VSIAKRVGCLLVILCRRGSWKCHFAYRIVEEQWYSHFR